MNDFGLVQIYSVGKLSVFFYINMNRVYVLGRNVCSGEPEWNAVYVVPDRVRFVLQIHEQVWRGPEEVPWNWKGRSHPLLILKRQPTCKVQK